MVKKAGRNGGRASDRAFLWPCGHCWSWGTEWHVMKRAAELQLYNPVLINHRDWSLGIPHSPCCRWHTSGTFQYDPGREGRRAAPRRQGAWFPRQYIQWWDTKTGKGKKILNMSKARAGNEIVQISPPLSFFAVCFLLCLAHNRTLLEADGFLPRLSCLLHSRVRLGLIWATSFPCRALAAWLSSFAGQ